ncbi:MAG: proteasome ATPase [Nitrospirae bacterium RIFCSPLOWO2_02_42_7]|nr:MAG: proteasome ATPase [Nitrospirae bacterium GWA2_42_11]OGW53284.1 MAG: proteasome ATPase [Nitrospirae bacterium RIFCSPLOWO2_02_42_7]OGW58804.1 MAG: proteasome ATPase [Nitrospirae bacterium RIFCSPHIGHO2_02_FULL_42_12]
MSESKKNYRLPSVRNPLKKSIELSKEMSKEEKIAEYEKEIESLCDHIKDLEEDVHRLSESRYKLDGAFKQNEKLTSALQEAKDQIQALRSEIEKLTSPPASYGVFTNTNDDGTVNVYVSGRKLKVNVRPGIEIKSLRKGQEVILNEALNIIEIRSFDGQGEVVRLKDRLAKERAIVSMHGDEERVAEIAEPLQGIKLSVGDVLLFDNRSGLLLEKLPKSEMDEVILEEVPDVTYSDIGGLKTQIETIMDAIELPFVYPELFKEYRLSPPKGVLLYGPPGCGKTLIAKAVANSIAKRLESKKGKDVRSYFLHVKGPELLNKYVGESERQIREVFSKAKDKAEEGMPVVVFFDEMDALFRTRGTGISSDVESTIVPQFLSEIDGVESLRNVIVIGASNRQDLIDPAILRPGRLDIKIRIDRPDKDSAKDIFGKYLIKELPFNKYELDQEGGDVQKLVERLVNITVEQMYSVDEENKFLEVTYANGEKEILYFKDFVSGAMIQGIVSRGKKYAIKRMITTGEGGIKGDDLLTAIKDEFKENEDLPNTTNPDDWAKIAGRKNERIVNVRTISGKTKESRRVETVPTGHYL